VTRSRVLHSPGRKWPFRYDQSAACCGEKLQASKPTVLKLQRGFHTGEEGFDLGAVPREHRPPGRLCIRPHQRRVYDRRLVQLRPAGAHRPARCISFDARLPRIGLSVLRADGLDPVLYGQAGEPRPGEAAGRPIRVGADPGCRSVRVPLAVGKQKKAAKEAAAKAGRRRNAAMKAEAKRTQEAQFFADLESGTTTRIRPQARNRSIIAPSTVLPGTPFAPRSW
jgi:hypothetical protein